MILHLFTSALFMKEWRLRAINEAETRDWFYY